MKYLKNLLYGLIFGVGSPVPGVSAGTVAVMLNVYDSFFNSISWAAARKNIRSIIFFLVGWGLGLLSISRAMMYLFEYHVYVISFLFIGLIAGCLPMLFKKATAEKVKWYNVIFCFAALGFMVFLTLFSEDVSANRSLEQMGGTAPGVLAWLFFASFVSSMAMLIPGVGGSLMMLVFGIYAVYIEAVAELIPIVLAVFGISMVLGVLAGIVITKKILARFSQGLYFAIVGFILGSLLIVYPGFAGGMTGAVSIGAAVVAFIFAYWMAGKG